MALIKSISGVRGTIGGFVGDNLTPQDIVVSTAAFGQWIMKRTKTPCVVVGRDARISGEIVNQLVCSTLQAMGLHVIDLGLSTTPTVAIAVECEKADGGIVITASHNPKNWNALKFLNPQGEFISEKNGEEIAEIIAKNEICYAPIDKLGGYEQNNTYIQKHIDKIFQLPLVDVEAIRAKNYKVVVDCINSTGAISIVPLLEQLNCEVVTINAQMTGNFNRNPEPLPENLLILSKTVTATRAYLGIATDPDVDRLAFVCEDGEMFGEEYTLVAVSDYVLQHKVGNTVSNLSSTRALCDVTERRGGTYFSSAVGEINVVEKMKEVKAVIGGEGNGGIIYPDLHYGRDALVGVALFLSYLADFGKPVSFLRNRFPKYYISKNKIQLDGNVDLDNVFRSLKSKYQHAKLNTVDGLKIELDSFNWIHLRRSNTEPIIRIYSESTSEVVAENLSDKIKMDITDILKGRNTAY